MSSTNVTLLQAVATQIAASGPKVEEILVGTLVNAEIEKRSDLLLKGLDLIKKGQSELNKIKADVKVFDAAGNATESFSADAWKKKGEAEQKQKKLVDAFNLALEKNDGESYG